jgi:hypothetical protein
VNSHITNQAQPSLNLGKDTPKFSEIWSLSVWKIIQGRQECRNLLKGRMSLIFPERKILVTHWSKFQNDRNAMICKPQSALLILIERTWELRNCRLYKGH